MCPRPCWSSRCFWKICQLVVGLSDQGDVWMLSSKELRVTRKRAGWSQRQLAERAGVHIQTVKYWERHPGLMRGWAPSRFEEAFRIAGIEPFNELHALLYRSQPRSRRRPMCGARNREGKPCRARKLPGKNRCKFHGGMSTGPKTPEGRQRIAEAQRRRWEAWRQAKTL